MVQNIGTISVAALTSFRTVAALGGISAAATKLGMAKSGVSRHVAQLEDYLGVRLLERGGRSVRLTPVGERLDHRIVSILAEIDLLGDIAREESVGVSGQVTIAATPEFGGVIARNVLPVIRQNHPNLTVVMRPDYSFEDMQDPNTDIAFRIGSFQDDRLIVRKLGTFRRILVASPEFLSANRIERPEDLAGLPCLTFRGDQPGGTWRFTSEEREVSVEVDGPLAIQNFSILMDMAIDGHGFVFLPQFMIGNAVKEAKLVRCLPKYKAKDVPVFLTYRPGARRIARVDAVISIALESVPYLLPELD